MDGFPKSVTQVTLIKQMKIKPSKVVLLECSEDESVCRLKKRQLDPVTGRYYNEDSLPEDEAILKRLKHQAED